jgi:site-specific DNA recombinase
MLCGILFDSSGVRFTPTHALKKGKRYRYYTSQSVIQGLKERPPITRFPAQPLEEFVSRQVGHYLQNFSASAAGIEHGPESELIQTRAHSLGERWTEISTERYHQLLHQLLTKVVVRPTSVELLLDAKKLSTELLGRCPEYSLSVSQLRCTARFEVQQRRGEVTIVPADGQGSERLNPSPSIVRAIRHARSWY